ncbi:MAG TPA: O-antigen ligase family protein [Gaiellaceae bacterium]|nr:O-antigen ligase family protein [Gaiellaceae bacterium]
MTRHGRLTEWLFLLTLFTITFAKLRWNVPAAGDLVLADVLTILFLVSFSADAVARRDARLPRTAVYVGAFGALFLLVYLVGFFNLTTLQAVDQFWKGLVKFVLHFAFLVAGIAYVVRRGERFYWWALGALVVGLAANAAYGVLQLAAAQAGVNLDRLVLSPLTGGASAINVYGAVEGQAVYRTNALTGDPNHLGIMLLVPLLVLAPIYLRLERGHRLRVPLAVLLGFLLVVQLTTLSRSAILGLVVGLGILAFPYRGFVLSRALLVPVGAVAAVVGAVVAQRLDFFRVILRSRTSTEWGSTGVHFDVYNFVPDVLASNPLFGLGLNNFSVYYEFVTGRTNWGPHSFYVATLVETGLVGSALFAVFLWYVFRRVRDARAIGRALAALRDPLAARVRPLAWGLTAALAATLVANLFYLTMIFYYFYAFAILALAAPTVFGRRLFAD